MPKGICSICASPILREVNDALAKGERLRELAARSGHSRASLSRHSRKCISRAGIAQHGNMSAALAAGARIILCYPADYPAATTGDLTYGISGSSRTLSESELLPTDIIVQIDREPPLPATAVIEPEQSKSEAAPIAAEIPADSTSN